MKRHLVPALSWPRVVGAWLLLLPGVVAFQPTFGGLSGYLTSFVGVTLGAGIALAAVGLGWSIALWVLALVAAYFLVGGPLVLSDTTLFGVVPSVETLRELALLIVFGWRDLLTVATPAGDFQGPAAVPLIAGLLVGTLGVGVVRATRSVHWVLVVPVVWLAFSIAFGVRTAPTAPWLGAVLGAGLVAWMTVHRTAAHRNASSKFLMRKETGLSRGAIRMISAALVIALAGGVAIAINLVGEERVNRRVLRDDIEPPLNLHEYPSPLMKYRLYELTKKDEVLFEVRGMPEGARLRLAVLNTYDGHVFNVSQDASQFLRSGRELPVVVDGAPREMTISAVSYDDVWLPSAGRDTWISFDGDRAKPQAQGLYVNRGSGQTLTTARFSEGSVLAAHAVPTVPHTEEQRARLTQAGAGKAQLAEVSEVPDVLVGLATDWTAEATSAYEQLATLSSELLEKGYYSNGADGKSRSGHNRERLSSMFNAAQWIGDDEQYATAMALMAHQLGIPVRVVMGFYPDEGNATTDVWEVKGADAHVWVEAHLDGAGWVSFDVTPDREPQTEVPQPKPKPKPQVDPPPNPPERLPEEPIVADEEPVNAEEEDQDDDGSWMLLLILAGAVIGGLGLLALPFAVIVGLKSRRAKRRRTSGVPAEQVAGAWDEIVDQARDIGYEAPSTVTRQEAAMNLQQAYPAVEVTTVAAQVDATVFGPVEPFEAQSEAAWSVVPDVKKALLAQVPWFKRLPALVSMRSLRKRPTEAALTRRRKAKQSAQQKNPKAKKGRSVMTGEDTKEHA